MRPAKGSAQLAAALTRCQTGRVSAIKALYLALVNKLIRKWHPPRA